jgi:hypothetical protein
MFPKDEEGGHSDKIDISWNKTSTDN